MNSNRLSRARGCLLGQLSGDSLGSLVEFRSPVSIRREYPDGVRDLADGGTWGTLAGQPTDDSEMALLLARSLVRDKTYDAEHAREAYLWWMASAPFDCGGTIAAALHGTSNPTSQANGALMRISPLGIFGADHAPEQVASWAEADAAITHPNPICKEINSIFARAIALAVDQGPTPLEIYESIVAWSAGPATHPLVRQTIENASTAKPADFVNMQGWVVIAFQNALWQLLHAKDPEQAVIDTVMQGGDTDTNAAICGALLGAVHGLESIPSRWVNAVVACTPKEGGAGVLRPRPQELWPVDALDLAARLLSHEG